MLRNLNAVIRITDNNSPFGHFFIGVQQFRLALEIALASLIENEEVRTGIHRFPFMSPLVKTTFKQMLRQAKPQEPNPEPG